MTDSVSFFVGRTSCNRSRASIGNAAAHSATARQTLSKSPLNFREAIAKAIVAFWARFASKGDARIARCCGLFRRTGAVDAFADEVSTLGRLDGAEVVEGAAGLLRGPEGRAR